ncbi:MAG TPA: class I SAM-dependent methyltransferase [Blastocatellia bacterium]|nr:class I SAM-dependent methyltransferase [Blastocatellia bacterium]
MSEDSGGHAAEEMRRLAARARELELVEPEVEELETHWRKITAAERLADLRRFIGGGKLLEIGCSTGELLAAVPASFRVTGVEADEAASSVARSRDLDCLSGTLFDAEFRDQEFDVVVMYHVIEHLPSPRQTLRELNRILRPGGWLVVETPNIANPWVSVLGARWRQFIPDHLYFFSPETIRKLCGDSGFEIRKLRRVGKSMSVRLFVSRLGRYSKPLARALSVVSHQLHLNDRTLRLNLGDVMRLYAQKQ